MRALADRRCGHSGPRHLFGATARDPKKHRAKRIHVTAPTVTRDYDGTPIIMQGYHRTYGIPDIMREDKGTPRRDEPTKRADRPIKIPRGSSTYIPPPVPSPIGRQSAAGRAAAAAATAHRAAADQHLQRPRQRTASTPAPFNAGLGNNPAEQQAYIGQCAKLKRATAKDILHLTGN